MDWDEETKGTINWAEPDVAEMTFKIMGDLTFVELGEQTFSNWFTKISGIDFTEETKGTVDHTEETKGTISHTEETKGTIDWTEEE